MTQAVTFGEALFRFSTKKGERLQTAQELDFFLGGSELNVAANLSSLGVATQWASIVPGGLMGELIKSRAGATGVDLSHVFTADGGRAGWYMLETGAAPRCDRVFQRSSSVMADEKSFPFQWSEIFKGVRVFHTSGIATGSSPELGREVEKAMREAVKLGAMVCYDFNYRKLLWSIEDSKARQLPLLPLIDVLFCSYSDLDLYFGWTALKNKPQELFKSGRLKQIVIGVRDDNETEYGVDLLTSDGVYQSQRYQVSNLDRIGVGDAMTAGFLAVLLDTGDLKRAAEFAAAAGAMKYSIQGDASGLKMFELEELVEHRYVAVRR